MIDSKQVWAELLARRLARRSLHDYITYTNPKYHVSQFSRTVCSALDKFIEDVNAGKRPVLIFQAPPQHGKSEMVSRKLPAYLLGRFPNWRIACASYAATWAESLGQDVRRNLASPSHHRLFPPLKEKRKYTKDTNGEFTSPTGDGSYICDGVGGGFTGRPADIFIIDDPTKNAQEALSETTKESHWNWFQSTSTTRMSANSGLIVMATSWSEDDLPGRIAAQYANDPRMIHLCFPAINSPDEAGYRPELPAGPLVPELHPLAQLLEIKNGANGEGGMSDYWWSALYQQSPKSLGGNVFKENNPAGLPCIQYWLPKDLPERFDKVIDSWDCTFKDTDGTDFVVGQKWGKKGANSYLLIQVRARMSFTATKTAVKKLYDTEPIPQNVLIEDKANGPAVIDALKGDVPGILPIEPDGSKLARAHAVTSYWEAQNIWLPHPGLNSWVKTFISELTGFPAMAHDDQVDALTQALRYLYPLFKRLKINPDAIKRAMGLLR